MGTLTVDRGDGGIYYAGEDIEFCYRLSPDGIKYDYLHYTRFGQMDEALTDVYQGNAVACFTKEAPYGAFGRHDFRGSFLVDGLVVAGASTFIYVVEEWEFFGEVEDISHDCLFQGACWAYVSVTEVLEGSLAEDEVIFVAGPDGDACEGYFDDSLFAGQLVVVRGVTDGSGTVDICPDPDYFIDFW